MPEEPKQESFDPPRDKPTVLFDGEGPVVMIVTIPIENYANDRENGSALVYGKFREAQAIAMNKLQEIRIKAAQKSGIITPSGSNLKVH